MCHTHSCARQKLYQAQSAHICFVRIDILTGRALPKLKTLVKWISLGSLGFFCLVVKHIIP